MRINEAIREVMRNKGMTLASMATAIGKKRGNDISARLAHSNMSFDKAIADRLKVMDQTAFSLCREGNMPIIVFDMNQTGNLSALLEGKKVGTLVHV